jgi:hypothetical protein
MWWNASIIPALVRLRQEDPEFEASLGSVSSNPPTKKKKITS